MKKSTRYQVYLKIWNPGRKSYYLPNIITSTVLEVFYVSLHLPTSYKCRKIRSQGVTYIRRIYLAIFAVILAAGMPIVARMLYDRDYSNNRFIF